MPSQANIVDYEDYMLQNYSGVISYGEVINVYSDENFPLSNSWLSFGTVDFPSFHFQGQKDLYSSIMVQGSRIFSCKD